MLKNLIYIYHNQKVSLNEILKRHPYSVVIWIKTPFFSSKEHNIKDFLEDFKNSSFDFKKTDNVFKYNKKFKSLIVRHPIKDTKNLVNENIIKNSLRDTHKIIDQILDFNREGYKEYITSSSNLKKIFTEEETIARSEYHKKRYEEKSLEIYDPDSDIKYASQKDIDKVRFDLGDGLFRDKIKKGISLFPGKDLVYDNNYLYKTYVEPYEKKPKGKK